MIGRKIAAVALSAVTVLALGAIPASAHHPDPCDGQDLRHEECPEAPPVDADCPAILAALRIEESTRASGNSQTVTVVARNDNPATNGGAFDAQLVVTYQAGRWSSNEQTVLAAFVADGGGTYAASFVVPRFRNADGIVRARVEDLGCDRTGESVSLS